jgi:hypothetical protein
MQMLSARQLAAAVVAVVSALCMNADRAQARNAAQSLSEACVSYVTDGLTDDLVDWIHGKETDWGFQEPVTGDNISVGAFVPAYGMTRGFVDGSVSGMDGIEAYNYWLAPILQFGNPIEVVTVYETSPGVCTAVRIGEGHTLAENLGSVPSGTTMVCEFPNVWYMIDGDTVSALNDPATATIRTTMRLRDFQDVIVARYADDLLLPEDTDVCGGAGGVAGSRPSSDAPESPARAAVVAVVLLAVVGIAAVLLAGPSPLRVSVLRRRIRGELARGSRQGHRPGG